MNVRTALKNLQTLVNDGHGDLELFGMDGPSGMSMRADIYKDTRMKTNGDDAGALCEEEDGFVFVPIYLD